MMRDLVRGLWGVALALGVVACFEDAPSESTGNDAGSGSASGTTSSPGTSDPDDSSGVGSSGVDAQCPAGFSCAAVVPAGWQGPVARLLGPEPALPDCGGDFPYLETEARSGLEASPAQCSSCACDEPDGVECDGPALRMYPSLSCVGAPSLQFELGAHDECVAFGEFGIAIDGMQSDPVVPVAGTGACTPSGGDAVLPEPGWVNHLRACGGAPDAGACGDGGSCLPTPGNPLVPGLCIWSEGDMACPGGPYALRNVFYDAFEDARACSACACADPSGVDCQALVEVHANASCGNLRASIDDPMAGVCYDIDNGSSYAPRSGRMIVYGTQGGACSPAGGQPMGEASPTGPITFCCTQ